MSLKNEQIKELISLADNIEEADNYIERYVGFKTIGEKFAFLTGLFGIEVLSGYDEDTDNPEEMLMADYDAVLITILNKKYR